MAIKNTVFFRVLFDEKPELGVGRVQNGMAFSLPYEGEMPMDVALIFELHDVDFPDYLGNDLGVRLGSPHQTEIYAR
jgi:hypothetical protein